MAHRKIVVVGAGPAGMMAAIRASQCSSHVILVEKNSLFGKKLLLSGKGRCNLTNTSDFDSFLERFSGNAEFLRDAFKKFFNTDLMGFFESRGLKLKVERQQRVFPVSDRSASVVEVLKKELVERKVEVILNKEFKDVLLMENAVKAVQFSDGKTIECDRVILATGGLSYSFTGSTGDGMRLAEKSGHRIVAPRPGLVALVSRQSYMKALGGLTLKNIRIVFSGGKKRVVSEIGEMLFTGSGISGPLVFTLSGTVVDWLGSGLAVRAQIDLKPALSEEQLDARLLREFRDNPKKSIRNILKNLLPQSLIDVFLGITKIDPQVKPSHLPQGKRSALAVLLKALPVDIARAMPLEEAIVTRGGVSLKDINPRTMESRIVKGLYFAGEMIDVDADTGGFNLQAAFSTGYLAGESAALS